MIEQDTIAGVHSVCLPVVNSDPVRVELGAAVGGARVEGSRLALRSFDDFAVELRRGRLVETDVFLEAACTDRVKKTESAQAIDIACILSHLEGDFDVRLGAQVVNLAGLNLSDDVNKIGAVAQIAVV